MSDSFVTPWIVATRLFCPWDLPGKHTGGNVLPFPSLGYLPDPWIESRSPALQADSLPTEPPGKSTFHCWTHRKHTTYVWETMETVTDFIWGGSKITSDGEGSHEIKRHLLLGREVMTNLDSILKSRHYFANKGPSSQGYGFSSSHVWM